jgi:hypothetical protein
VPVIITKYLFPVQARPLISIATYNRGVLLEFPVTKTIAYDKNFRYGKSLSERIHIAFVTVGLPDRGIAVVPFFIIEYLFCYSSYASDFNCY